MPQEMTTISNDQDLRQRFQQYRRSNSRRPLFVCGNTLQVLGDFPAGSIDFYMTSPPYLGHRQYANEGIGLEENYHEYVAILSDICGELHRVLRDTGSF
jgi:DNA modification methylase